MVVLPLVIFAMAITRASSGGPYEEAEKWQRDSNQGHVPNHFGTWLYGLER